MLHNAGGQGKPDPRQTAHHVQRRGRSSRPSSKLQLPGFSSANCAAKKQHGQHYSSGSGGTLWPPSSSATCKENRQQARPRNRGGRRPRGACKHKLRRPRGLQTGTRSARPWRCSMDHCSSGQKRGAPLCIKVQWAGTSPRPGTEALGGGELGLVIEIKHSILHTRRLKCAYASAAQSTAAQVAASA